MIKKIIISTFFDILKNVKHIVQKCVYVSYYQCNSKINGFQNYLHENKD